MSETCQSCGVKYDTVYRVPDRVWAIVSGRDDEGGLLCPECCDAIARQDHGIVLYWEAAVDRYPVDGVGLGPDETRRRYDAVLETIKRQRETLGFAPRLDNLERLVRDLGIAIGLEAVAGRQR